MIKLNYIVIPAFTLLVSIVGSWLTSKGMSWYNKIELPSWTPSGGIIGSVWTAIFVLSTVSAIIVWNQAPHDSRFVFIFAIFLINAFLNVFWSYLFFYLHDIGAAFVEAILLDASVIALIVLIWPVSMLAARLLMPYAVWVTFASYLTYVIWKLNK